MLWQQQYAGMCDTTVCCERQSLPWQILVDIKQDAVHRQRNLSQNIRSQCGMWNSHVSFIKESITLKPRHEYETPSNHAVKIFPIVHTTPNPVVIAKPLLY